MKSKRHAAILNIISNGSVETQEELIGRLRENGFEVTQATISRDIREMKLTKVMTESGVYRYAAPKTEDSSAETSGIRKNVMSSAVKSVDYAGNCIVIKTNSGMANAVAVALDSMTEPDILGCVAGDDAIIIVTRSEKAAGEISVRIRNVI